MTPEEQKIIDDKAIADKKALEAAEDPAETAAGIKALADELGITPGQIKGRLEALRKYEKAAKIDPNDLEILRVKAKELDATKEANKTEQQRLLDRIAAAEKAALETSEKLTASEQKVLRSEIAASKGVPVGLLVGTTQEELEAQADALITFRGEVKKPNFGQGANGDDVNGKTDFDTQIAAAQVAGKFQEAIALKQQQHAESLNNK